jgi:hypothetical protein
MPAEPLLNLEITVAAPPNLPTLTFAVVKNNAIG